MKSLRRFPNNFVILTSVLSCDSKIRAKDLVLRFFSRRWRDQNDANRVFQRKAKGFTLIELVMIIVITGVLSMAGYHIMQFVIRNAFLLPNQVQADLVAAEALEIIVEGDSSAKGLRFCKAVTTAGANQVIVTNQDNRTITYHLSGGSLYRTIAPGSPVMIPYFKAGDMTISGAGGSLFTYYDASNLVTAVPANVRRIDVDLIAQHGAGSSDKYEGISEQGSSIKVNKYL